jgi:hypothetical protein
MKVNTRHAFVIRDRDSVLVMKLRRSALWTLPEIVVRTQAKLSKINVQERILRFLLGINGLDVVKAIKYLDRDSITYSSGADAEVYNTILYEVDYGGIIFPRNENEDLFSQVFFRNIEILQAPIFKQNSSTSFSLLLKAAKK